MCTARPTSWSRDLKRERLQACSKISSGLAGWKLAGVHPSAMDDGSTGRAEKLSCVCMAIRSYFCRAAQVHCIALHYVPFLAKYILEYSEQHAQVATLVSLWIVLYVLSLIKFRGQVQPRNKAVCNVLSTQLAYASLWPMHYPSLNSFGVHLARFDECT